MKGVAVSVLALFVVVASGATIQENVQVRQAPLTSVGQSRIVGGSVTDISNYPFVAPMLYDMQDWIPHTQSCVASILTSRALLSAAGCYETQGVVHETRWWKSRVGSTYGNSGGFVHNVAEFVSHPDFDHEHYDSDIIIVRLATSIIYIPNQVSAGFIAGSDYNVADGAEVTIVGWGATGIGGDNSPALRHTEVTIINQEICKEKFALIHDITENMICSGILNQGGKGHCAGDVGSPIIHRGAIVGMFSWSRDCGHEDYPSVNVRVSRFTNWITENGSS